MQFNPIMLPGPGNGGPLNAQGMLAQILARAQQQQLPLPVRQAPNMNAIHQQVAALANRIGQGRLPSGQAKPYQGQSLPQGGFSPSLTPGNNPFLQIPPQDQGQGGQPGQSFGPGQPGFYIPGFHGFNPMHSFPNYQ